MWSTPIEELFGFPPGRPGFSVHVGSWQDSVSDAAAVENRSGDAGPGDIGMTMLAPILDPIRAGTPRPSSTSTDPDRTGRRGPHAWWCGPRPAIIPDGPGRDRPTSCRPPTSAWWSTSPPSRSSRRELSDLVDRYRLLTEVSPDAMVVHQNGRLVFGNRAGRQAGRGAGRCSTTSAGRSPTSSIPDDVPGMVERLAQLTEDGQFFEHGEARIVSDDGVGHIMEVISIRTSWAGEPAYQVIMRDISERKAAEAADRYRASLVAHVSDAIIGIDAEGRIESWNEARPGDLRLEPRKRWPGCPSPPWSRPTGPTAPSVLERGQRTHRRKDGSEVDVLVSIDPLIDDDTQPSGWVVVSPS